MTTIDNPSTVGSGDADDLPRFADYVRADQGVPVPAYLLEQAPICLDNLTIDSARYISSEFLELEAQRLWPKVWQQACRENDIPNVGDYFEYTIMDTSVLIVRSDPSTIRAFRNACRHRGTALATGSGNAACFSCPFHGWTYRLDGSLQYVPAGWEFGHVDEADIRLPSVRVETIDGYVFINLDDNAEPLTEFLGETVCRHLPQTPDEGMVSVWHFEAVLACNWKVGLEAFMEAYHIARTHPQLAPFVSDVQAQNDSYGLHVRVTNPFAVSAILAGTEFTQQEIMDSLSEYAGLPPAEVPEGRTARDVMAHRVRELWNLGGIDLSRYSDSEILDAIEYVVFPNALIFRNAAGHQNFRFRPNGNDPNSCLFDVYFLVPAGADRPRDSAVLKVPPGVRFQDHEPCNQLMGGFPYILDQDLSNFPLIQKGLHSMDRLSLGSWQERAIVQFERNLDGWLEDHA